MLTNIKNSFMDMEGGGTDSVASQRWPRVSGHVFYIAFNSLDSIVI